MKHRALESAREERIKQRAARIVRKAIREARESTVEKPKKMSESKQPKRMSATKKMMEIITLFPGIVANRSSAD